MSDWKVERLNYIKEHPEVFIDALMKHTYKRLGQKLDIVREQKQMAFNQKNDLSFKYLHELEDLIGECRIRKGEDMDWSKPDKKVSKKRKKKVEENFNAPIEKEEIEPQDWETDNNDKYEPEQLSFDF